MKIAIMQPYLFPYIGYFQLVNSVNKFVVYDDVAFIKQGWINRNNILLNQQKHLFFVPVKGISSFRNISETEIDYTQNWPRKMLLTFEQAYKKSPYFQNIFPIIQSVFNSKKQSISELAFDSIFQVCNYLDIDTEFSISSKVYQNQEIKGQDRVIDICLKENATQYINPIGGLELYSNADFLDKNIQLNFIQSLPHSYKQFNNEFVPWLSIIDVLMFNSKESTKLLLNEYKLV
jgi:hypothetical protein